jgi:hypothetical protein
VSKSLVIARVGATSLHEAWVETDEPRDWDLFLCPFQDVPFRGGPGLVVGDVIPGPKWSGIRELLHGWDGWREYDYIWFPDDDIAADGDTISEMFEVARTVDLRLFAPALAEESYFAHFITMRNPRFSGRWTGFVEIMMPGFQTRTLETLLPTLDLTRTGWGWGLDSVWPKRLHYEGVGIIDSTPVTHTRPVGEMRDEELRRSVHGESDAMLAAEGCRQMHVNYGAFGPDGQRLPLSPEQMLFELVQGWEYLIEGDPRVLSWVAAYQGSAFDVPDYPVAGTPRIASLTPASR